MTCLQINHLQDLLMIKSWEDWLIYLKTVLPFNKTWTDWEVGQGGTWWGLTSASVEYCTWGGTTSCTSTGYGMIYWRGALQRRTWGSWWTTGWPWASSVPWWSRPRAPWDVLKTTCGQQVKRGDPHTLLCWGHIQNTVPISGLPSTKKDKDLLEGVRQEKLGVVGQAFRHTFSSSKFSISLNWLKLSWH